MEPDTIQPSSQPSPRPNAKPAVVNLEPATEALESGLSEIARALRLRTHWPRTERICSPRSGRFWVVGGNPGNYKTQAMWNLALDMAERRHRVLFVSLEQSTGQLAVQAVTRYSRVSWKRLEAATMADGMPLSPEEADRVEAAKEKLRGLQLFLRLHGSDKHGRSLDAVVRSATRSRFDAVFIDHIQIIGRDGGRSLDNIPVTVDRLKCLAHGEIVTDYTPFVCALSPLNRANERDAAKDEDRLPSMSDFYGAREIESDADTAIIMRKRQRPAEDESDAPDTVDGFVLKQRWGKHPLVLVFEAQGSICHVVERHRSDTNSPAPHWSQREPGEDQI